MSNGVEIRSFQPDDFSAVVALLNRCLHEDQISSEIFQRKVLLDQNYDPRGSLVAVADGKIVGYALGLVRRFQIEDSAPDFDRSWITLIGVDEPYRRRGIAKKLVEQLEAFFKENDCKLTFASSYAPNYFIPGVDVNAYAGALDFFKAIGYAEVYRPLSMDANIVHLQTPEWVNQKEEAAKATVKFEHYRPELILPILEFMKAEFPGDWQRYARDTMTRITTGEYWPDYVWVASENDKVIGYAQFGNDCRFGPFGVSSSERGRGIGMVLLFRVLQTMRARGLHNAWFLWTDDVVAKLYDVAGFQESRRFALMKKTL